MNTWYEVSIILEAENKKIHVVSTESLELAQNKKQEFLEAGIKAIVEEWKIKNEEPILMGVI